MQSIGKVFTEREREAIAKRTQREKDRLYGVPDAVGFSVVLGPLSIVMRDDIPTAATDGKQTYWNHDFVNQQNDLELRGVHLHEAYHVSGGHHLRRGDRDPYWWNVACDYVINGMIRRMKGYGVYFVLPDDHLYDDFYSNCGKSEEWIYRKLVEANGINRPPPKPPEGAEVDNGQGTGTGEGEGEGEPEDADGCEGEGDGEPDPNSNGSGSSLPDGEHGGQADPNGTKPPSPSDGEGEGVTGEPDPDGQDGTSEGDGEPESQIPEGFGDFEISGGVWDAPPDVDPVQETEELAERVTDAEVIEKAVGSGTGGGALEKWTDTEDPTVPYEQLKELMESVLHSQEYSWHKCNRRFLSDGSYFPSTEPSYGTAHFFVDVSGSMTAHELRMALGNCRGVVEELNISNIRISFGDGNLQMNVDADEPDCPWFDYDMMVDSVEDICIHTRGRGGTSFDPIFDYIEENDEADEVQALIFITDTYGSVHVDEPDYNVIWLSTSGPNHHGECRKPSFYTGGKLWSNREPTEPWGTFIDISNSLEETYY